MKSAAPVRTADATATEPPSSVAKACRILRAIGALAQPRLTDIAQATELDKATVLRLLDALAREGFVQRDAQTKLYRAGPELQLAGVAALARIDPRAIVRPSLLRLAHRFEDTAILSVPSGTESLCLDLELGRYPIRANYLEPGHRRLLGVGAGSLALLAWLPAHERDAVLDIVGAQLQRTQRYPAIDRALLQANATASRARGHAVLLDVVVERMGGIGVPILGADGRPVAALSIAALSDRITGRETELAQALQHEAALCQSQWPGAASTPT
ncbi:IclR family transcriptional regulator [Pseudorhodoferax sp. Leaf267]|uniref:IclR family transcriptional regulator n=1 Tax=Pseudorhodoferax sp. Leaf267 TaxID=1736316 RepID=UPI0006FE73BD|nr:helix-turn-helix domain-containing protein [Pseudorhodoferax sp. Leaf267]KQP15145.1 IclR family transcriptional regulator [Pseudorhodoferax sp. Leaf267]